MRKTGVLFLDDIISILSLHLRRTGVVLFLGVEKSTLNLRCHRWKPWEAFVGVIRLFVLYFRSIGEILKLPNMIEFGGSLFLQSLLILASYLQDAKDRKFCGMTAGIPSFLFFILDSN